MTSNERSAEADAPSAIEDAAGEQLGVGRWDRPLIFQETAAAATDNDLPYWSILMLSGAIATLGLALDSSAVVIGAMLVAPLLAPVVGLSLALAMGDGRLALQTGAVVLGSVVAVVLTAAVCTALLPFQSITLEITSRIQPTTLDLGIAVCSGLVGAVVTVARGHRLSAAIPGVAIAVALIPPLSVAGFGMGAGWQRDLIGGSLLLFAANLAGIVLAGVGVFLLVGMHRQPVVEAARAWHAEATPNGLARWVILHRWAGSLDIFSSAPARGGLVVVFAGILAVPLTGTLKQVSREIRVQRAVSTAAELLEVPGRTSVLGRQVTIGERASRAHVRLATAEWVGADQRALFERRASSLAEEPVQLVLEQLPASAGGVEELAGLFPSRDPPPSAALEPMPALLGRARDQARAAVLTLPMPGGAQAVGVDLEVADDGGATAHVAYVAADSLQTESREVLTGALRAALDDPDLVVQFVHLGVTPAAVRSGGPGSAARERLAALLARYTLLDVEVLGADTAALGQAGRALREAGIAGSRVIVTRDSVPTVRVRLRRRQ